VSPLQIKLGVARRIAQSAASTSTCSIHVINENTAGNVNTSTCDKSSHDVKVKVGKLAIAQQHVAILENGS